MNLKQMKPYFAAAAATTAIINATHKKNISFCGNLDIKSSWIVSKTTCDPSFFYSFL
jgi:hypothetical protein